MTSDRVVEQGHCGGVVQWWVVQWWALVEALVRRWLLKCWVN